LTNKQRNKNLMKTTIPYSAQTLTQWLALLLSLYKELRSLAYRWTHGVAILLVTATLAACGGGGGAGDTGSTSGGPPPVVDSAPTLALLAGHLGGSGNADGTGAAARFRDPEGVTVDNTGNVYVADTKSHTIRKITPAGVVTTLAGTAGAEGSDDGTGAAARFSDIRGVTVDNTGNVYVADKHAIRRITPAGVVTTLAGTAHELGSDDGTGAAARFREPVGVTVDTTGTV
jgi:hypothetical protein